MQFKDQYKVLAGTKNAVTEYKNFEVQWQVFL